MVPLVPGSSSSFKATVLSIHHQKYYQTDTDSQLLKQTQVTMCGIFSELFYETYNVWDHILLSLGSLLTKLGL